MSKHWCQAEIRRAGQHFWGHALEGPCCDPIPPELLEQFPDVLTDWALCEDCGTPICGQQAQFVVRDDEETIWLCAKHYDEFVDQRWINWHQCRDAG